MIYIMVTNFSDHWRDKQRTYYTSSMLRNGLNKNQLKNNTKTYFIKRNANKEIEKCCTGNISDITNEQSGGKDIIRFKVNIEKEIECPAQYKNYSEGWYSSDELIAEVEKPGTNISKDSEPAFFDKLRGNLTWEEFEDNTYRLLKLIGIHTIHQYDKHDQRGKADGFFKISNMTVMYDCTLETHFEKSKNVQIDNYCGQLMKDRIKIDSNEYSLKDCDKFVWIVTKNVKTRLIKKSDDVTVKEVSILDLIKIYHKRLEDSSMNEKQLVKELEKI